MAYTALQLIRRVNTRERTNNIHIARALRLVADMLDAKGREEFSREDIKVLQMLRGLLTTRLETNALRKAIRLITEGQYQTAKGKIRVKLNPKDL